MNRSPYGWRPDPDDPTWLVEDADEQATIKRIREERRVPTIEEVTRWIGRLGGHLGRKPDGMPGVRTLWRGWRDLAILVAGYRAGRRGSK